MGYRNPDFKEKPNSMGREQKPDWREKKQSLRQYQSIPFHVLHNADFVDKPKVLISWQHLTFYIEAISWLIK